MTIVSSHARPENKQSGFSMVEALVALVVLGVGMLGIASLYVVTLRTSGSAISRMQAVNLASDLGDRIRANRMARSAYALDGIEDEEAEEDEESEESADCMGADKDCNAAAMAAYDLSLWQQQVVATLPSAQATVVVETGTTPTTYTITVSWLEAQENDAANADPEDNRLSYVMRMQI
jgi:type IV pilus assembly protein PilV